MFNKKSKKSTVTIIVVILILLYGWRDKISHFFGYSEQRRHEKAVERQSDDFEQKVKDVIVSNPQLIIDSVQKHQEKKVTDEMNSRITNNQEKLENSQFMTAFGNPNGDAKIIMFSDYRCGYCRSANESISAVLKQDKNLYVIYKELPILGEDSVKLSRAALAVYLTDPTKYADFHNMIFANSDSTPQRIERLVQDLGMDVKKFQANLNDKRISDELVTIKAAAMDIGLSGTPFFIVNGKVAFNLIKEDAIKKYLENLRQK